MLPKAYTFRSRTRQVARSLLIAALPILVVGAWGNSYVLGDWILYYDPSRPLFVRLLSDSGRLSCSWYHTAAMYDAGWNTSVSTGTYAGGAATDGAVLGFRVDWMSSRVKVQVPYWFVAALATMPAARALSRRWRHGRSARRLAANECVTCGYDLRGGSADRCPECGSMRAAPGQPPA